MSEITSEQVEQALVKIKEILTDVGFVDVEVSHTNQMGSERTVNIWGVVNESADKSKD